jgi:hypothetical protein
MFMLGSGLRGARVLSALLAGRVATAKRLSSLIMALPVVFLLVSLLVHWLLDSTNAITIICDSLVAISLPAAMFAKRAQRFVETKISPPLWNKMNKWLDMILPLRWFGGPRDGQAVEQRVYGRGDRVTALHVACAVEAVWQPTPAT